MMRPEWQKDAHEKNVDMRDGIKWEFVNAESCISSKCKIFYLCAFFILWCNFNVWEEYIKCADFLFKYIAR